MTKTYRSLGRSVASLFFCSLTCLGTASAETTQSYFASPKTTPSASFEIFGGALAGRSRELVFNDDKKVSELFWTIDQAAIVGGAITLTPSAFSQALSFRVKGWLPVSSKNTLDDYDWMSDSADWTDWSHTSDTRMKGSYEIDASARVRLFSNDQITLQAIGGFKRTVLGWTAVGGNYVYNNGEDVGSFEDVPGITYKQKFNTPYLGIGGSATFGRYTLSSDVIGSLWGSATDRDDHHLRNITFRENFHHIPMVGANAMLSYQLTDAIALNARLEGEKYFETKGNMLMTSSAGEKGYSKKGAGIASTLLTGTVGVTFNLS